MIFMQFIVLKCNNKQKNVVFAIFTIINININQTGNDYMDNFSIVLSLCRTALQNPTPALKRHIERLSLALEKQEEKEQALSLTKLLSGVDQGGKMEPSRVILSRQALNGEIMSPTVKAPVDRETGAALASIELPSSQIVEAPILNDSLQEAINLLTKEWIHIDRLKEAGIRPPLNCLIFGAPGTGKTKLAHVVASHLSLPLVTARLDGLISSFLGTTARNIATLFEFANRYQCILLLDEFDAVAKIRDDPHEVGEIKRVVNTLLQCLDGRSSIGFTIAITNHEQLLDSAIWRRFDSRIFVPKPDAVSRKTIITKYLTGLEVIGLVERDFLAWLTDGYSGSEIETLCNALKRYSVMQEEPDFDVIEALKNNMQLSADHTGSIKRELFLSSPEDLAKALAEDSDFSFRLDDLSQLFQKDPSTISRWIKKTSKNQKVNHG